MIYLPVMPIKKRIYPLYQLPPLLAIKVMTEINGLSGQSGANVQLIINVEKDLEVENVFVTDLSGYPLRLAMNLVRRNLKNASVPMEIVRRMLMYLITLLGFKLERK